MAELRKYGVLLTTARAISFYLYQVDGIDLEPSATFVAGDVTISKDGGAEANIANLPVDEGQGYRIILTAAELTASRVRIAIVDQSATKVWLDITIVIETYGNASAMQAFDLDLAATGTGGAGLTSQNVRDAMKLSPTAGAPAAGSVDLALDNIEADTNELQSDDIPGLIETLNDFDPAVDVVENVTLVGTTTTNADLVTALENADALLNRDMSAVSDTNARSPINALRLLRNQWSVLGTTMTVTKEDDTTTAWTSVVSTDAAADPVVGSNPS